MQWWHDRTIMNLITTRICGKPKPSIECALSEYLFTYCIDQLPFNRGVSNGCGVADKEYHLFMQGIVQEFDIYDFDKDRIELAKKKYKNLEGFNIIHGDALEAVSSDARFDFILWCAALHHMPDVYKALEWTYEHLSDNGVMLVFEYCGANRLGLKDTSKLKWHEALDSERIEQALRDTFKGIEIIPLGGAYFRKAIHGKTKYNVKKVIDRDNEMFENGAYDFLFTCWRKGQN